MKYYAARYDIRMFSKRKLTPFGDPADGSRPAGSSYVVLGQPYDTAEDAIKAVEAGNADAKAGPTISCRLKNGKPYKGPQYRYELVNSEE